MKKKLSILFFVASIVLASIQFFYQFDGTIGFLFTVFAVWFMMASIVLGGKVKEFITTFAEFFL